MATRCDDDDDGILVADSAAEDSEKAMAMMTRSLLVLVAVLTAVARKQPIKLLCSGIVDPCSDFQRRTIIQQETNIPQLRTVLSGK
mmetsp:Transcript_5226/g.7871  ORF Transcript_5226/g.7871 Transcript_5226/m.7871 type:complete len:86 (+) Transcript_5226:683-940(+)